MNSQTLAVVAKLRGKRPADLARMAHVSRAAVSLWMKSPVADVRAGHLERVAAGLNVDMNFLMKSLPLLADRQRVKTLEASLLWDRMYGSLADFVLAIVRRDLRAIARLVQVYGLFQSEKIIGRAVWRQFSEYRHFLHPARRTECEKLCRELATLKLI